MAQTPATWDDYVGDGVEDTYQVTFPYQKEQEVFAYVDGVLASFTFISAGWIQFDVIPPDQSAVRIIRSTEAFEPRHEFENGVPLLPRFLDENNNQFLYVVQEAVNETSGVAAEALVVAEAAEATSEEALALIEAALADSAATLRSDLLAPDGTTHVTHTAAGAGAVPRSIQSRLRDVVSVKDFGAVGDGTTDDTAAIQAAITAVATSPAGGVVCFPPVAVSYRTTAPLVISSPRVSLLGAGRKSRVLNQVGNLLQIGNSAADFFDVNLRSLHLQATAGHVITLGAGSFWSVSSVEDCYLLCGANTNVLRYIGATGGMFDINFNGGEIASPPNSTQNLIYVEGSVNVFSANQFNRVRFQTNGNPAKPSVELICNGAGQYFFNNKFTSCNFEIPNAGAIKVHGGNGTEVVSCAAFDVGTTTQNLWEFGATAPGVPCRNTVLTAVNRFGGTRGGGLYDIYLQSAQHTTMVSCEGTAAGGINHNINNQAVVILSNGAATLTNLNATNSARIDNLLSILQSLTTNGTLTANGTVTMQGTLDHNGTQVGFYGAAPVNQPAAQANTTGATLAVLEGEVNSLKQKLRNLGLMAT